MPAGNPLGYFAPAVQQQVMSALLGMPVPTLMPGSGSHLTQGPPLEALAAGVIGLSQVGFGRKTDQEVMQLMNSKNPRNRASAIQEYNMRGSTDVMYGGQIRPALGVPGSMPLAPIG